MKAATKNSGFLGLVIVLGLASVAATPPARAGQSHDCPAGVEVAPGGQRCALAGAAAVAGWVLRGMTFDATVGPGECPSGGAELVDGRIFDHWDAGHVELSCSYQQAQALYVINREAAEGLTCYRDRDLEMRPVKIRFICR